jgi:hypothetical protein
LPHGFLPPRATKNPLKNHQKFNMNFNGVFNGFWILFGFQVGAKIDPKSQKVCLQSAFEKTIEKYNL